MAATWSRANFADSSLFRYLHPRDKERRSVLCFRRDTRLKVQVSLYTVTFESAGGRNHLDTKRGE